MEPYNSLTTPGIGGLSGSDPRLPTTQGSFRPPSRSLDWFHIVIYRAWTRPGLEWHSAFALHTTFPSRETPLIYSGDGLSIYVPAQLAVQLRDAELGLGQTSA